MTNTPTLTINLGAVQHNWRTLAAAAPQAETAAVVKADAYGLGMAPVARTLATAGCRTFFVAHLEEAISLREILPEAIIYVLHGISGNACQDYTAHQLRPVLNSMPEIERWTLEAAAYPAALHVDSGMNRLGLPAAEFMALAVKPLAFNAALLISHFVESELPTAARTRQQVQSFAKLRACLPQVPASLANSCGIYVPEATHNLTRPGIALYGGNPTPAQENPMLPVATLTAPILQVRQIQAGESAGYCASFTATRPSTLATCALGYADGWLRSGSNKGQAEVAGVLCPLVGNISMDLIIIDVTAVPLAALTKATHATLLDDKLTVDAVAASMGTISYEVLTRFGPRLQRSYISG